MQKIGVGFWLVMMVSTGLTLCGVYIVYLGMQVGDERAPWLLGLVFPVSLPLLFGVFRILSRRSPLIERFYSKASGTDRPEVARFVPHWFTMAAIVIVGLTLLFGFISWIVSLLGR